MTIYNLYIFDRHCQCIYYQKWSHSNKPVNVSTTNTTSNSNSQLNNSSSRLGGLATSSSRFSTSSATSNHSSPMMRSGTNEDSNTHNQTMQQSGMAAGSVISIEEEAKLVYGVVLSLRNFVRKLNGNQDGFISYKTTTYRLHYYETPTGLKFVMNSDPNTENLRLVLKQIYIQLYVEFVVKNGLMRFDDTRWEISHGLLSQPPPSSSEEHTSITQTSALPSSPPGNISNELFRIAVDRFIRSLKSFE
ncbi:Sybindin-like family-domain-containing protein [Gilbertella persicaria]|uniref:Sybindin-like family-domain-containing protein n=1 Tax=Gilbertella persicaria TaxID=101096 RepID=UPI00221E8F6D|nr:Sybindin-like family-domain-containing protein [Gilbertella persicaria]KAI8073457.1 Sybindin-like family-domain-containing protein [Gilbertella persicaria]